MGLKQELKARKITQPDTFTAQEIRLISELLSVDEVWAFSNLFR